ncbi:arylsulfatase [Okeania sp.]|uniref:arylsulfatase n=1 Tax=Okeania sp. TaxID=3100323 RepID=UPI002B4B2FAE|nr:arylsulfatase [Okeania sp.]MEB3340863.1 arylsulfatase [Okeania sp.]
MIRCMKMGIAMAMSLLLLLSGILPWFPTAPAFAQETTRPNILVIMGDDIGWTNISAYEKGIVGYDTPNIDRIANEGMLFTDYYAEQSCTAGRAAFITGQSGLRTGLLKVGFPGAPFGIQDGDPTLAEMLKPLGYTTAQFGKNHLGDLNKFLPTVHGFDEFFGNLYHLNAEEEPENPDYPGGPNGIFANTIGPRGVLDCKASNVYDENLAPGDKLGRFGSLGKQTCEDTGPLNIERMKTVDREFLDRTKQFIAKSALNNQPFFTWFNSTRMHFYTHISDDVEGISGQGFYGDGMLEHDGHVGELLDFLDNLGIADNTIVIYTTDNGPHYNMWPDGGLSPFRGEKNTNWEAGYRVPALIRWPGHIPAGTVSHEIFSHLDWVPTLMAAAGVDEYLKQNQDLVKKLESEEKDVTLKNALKLSCEDGSGLFGGGLFGGKDEPTKFCGTYLDGFNQLSYLTNPEEQPGKRPGFIYFNDEGQLPGVRLGDWKVVFAEQRAHYYDVWREPFVKLRLPKLFNLRRDPYERADTDSNNYNDWYSRRQFLLTPAIGLVQKYLSTFDNYPPSQPPFSSDPDKIIEDIVDEINVSTAD